MKIKQSKSKKISKAVKSKSSKGDLRNISLVKNVLFKPARYKYIRKQEVVKGCVFCNSSKSISMDTLCVYKSEYSMIVLNKFPYNSGHLLVLPQQHSGDLLKLTSDQYADLMATVKLACQAVTDIYAPSAFNLGMNHGSAAGAGIPDHLHFHVIPRWAGDLNFFPLIAQTKVVIETLEQTYQNYLGYFNSRVKS
ncbi:MAG: HIT family hydrolase [Bdellovibrio sp. 28-41-41]|nr:MAG: HIT family hydrolase [Bdellovibrio sp. 28-41-41]